MLKHYKNMGFSIFCVFVVEREENRQKKVITENSGFCFLVQEWPFRDAYAFFKRKCAETPNFIVFLRCTLFGPSCQKKGNFGHPPKKKKILTDT